jgi:hypothetical protein
MFRLRQNSSPLTNSVRVVCTACNKETSFTGLNCPIACAHCDELLPDALDLHYNKEDRIVYHKDKEIFV